MRKERKDNKMAEKTQNEDLITMLQDPGVVNLFKQFLGSLVKERQDKENKSDALAALKQKFNKEAVMIMERRRAEIEEFQDQCIHMKEGMQESAISGQGTHQPGRAALGCCVCGKVYNKLSDVPILARSAMDMDAIGGPINTQFNV